MGRILLLWVLIGCLLFVDIATAARGGGGRGSKAGGSRKGYGSRMHILIQHRNPASASYYDHKDVSIQKQMKLKLIQLLQIMICS
jgi:hypothetical protein